uniref:B-cell receptor CD22 n=1 Tax=Amphiprion percula TaxID=161767 RepID=A0A3P8RZA3_AMPPE
MNAHTLWWLVFLTQIKNFPCSSPELFILQEPTELTATEGSCIEIKLEVKQPVSTDGAHWFWMKDPKWTNSESRFSGTIIYSTNQTIRPLSLDFKNRVTFTCTPNITETSFEKSQCNILICDLNKMDSGNYSFRFVGKDHKWMAKPERRLKVTDNPCPITFEQPPVVRENSRITLTCSTLSSCPSKPKIEPLTQLASVHRPHETSTKTSRVTTVRFTASWMNDGNEFTCQTSDNKDKYLVRRTNIVVEYAPKWASAMISSSRIKEGDTVTLTCSSKGQPNLSFTWFRNEEKQFSGAKWTIGPINSSHSGSYYCEAENYLGGQRSGTVTVDVMYVPDVEVQISKEPKGSLTDIKQGDMVTLTCNVKRSNPWNVRFSWAKDGKWVGRDRTFVRNIQPKDSGNYTCTATNDAGPGTSKPYRVLVQYRPRNTRISPSEAQNTRVKVNSTFMFTCITDAEPAALFSWYKQTDSSQWTPIPQQGILRLERLQRTDEACYRCNAANKIGMGDMSEPVCIQVTFPPTSVMLSMDTEVTEGQLIPISCTAESFPPSHFTIMRNSASNHQLSDWKSSQSNNNRNVFHSTINASSTDAGVYTCKATNSEGTEQSKQRKLVVKYTPKEVKVEAQPDLTVKENMTFTLDCRARSYPPVTSVIWMKKTNGRNEVILSHQKIFSVKSASPSDSGLYNCTAMNDIGAGKSPQVEVKVKYAPKHATILKGEEQQSGRTRSVTLSCITQCYPEVRQYLWYKKTYDKKGDEKVSESQNFTVYSDQKGEYYCIAENEINQKTSDPIRLFDDRLMMAVKIFCLICLLLLICLLIFFLYRRRRNKSNQQGTTQPSCGSLGWRNRGRSRMDETALTKPFRSRDDLFPDQPCRPNAQRCQPHPDNTSASSINTVYATVNLDSAKPAPSAPMPKQKHDAHLVNDSLNYASLHFGNKQKKPEEDVVYAKVSKAKASNEMERLPDYENVSSVCAARLPDLSDSDSDTSEDEVEVSYSQVNFRPKLGHQRSSSDTSSDSTSSEDETQYSQVKI